MKFSVIIPLYNKERHIKRAIDSVLAQTFKEFELIIIDDGSTDNSYNVVSKVSDSRLRYIRKENGGVSSARNYGIDNSNFNLICFLDADDMWKPTFLESIYNSTLKYPKASVFATSYEYGINNSLKQANINLNLAEGEIQIVDYFYGALKDPLISASSVVIERKVFNEVGLFSTELTRGEDLEMWCRIALRYEIVYINKPLSIYFQDTDNKLTKMEREYSTSFMSRIETLLQEQKKQGNYTVSFEEYMISRLMNKINYLISIGRKKQARKILWNYRYTKYSKKKWILNYFLSFGFLYKLYILLRKQMGRLINH